MALRKDEPNLSHGAQHRHTADALDSTNFFYRQKEQRGQVGKFGVDDEKAKQYGNYFIPLLIKGKEIKRVDVLH